ncbi:MAG: PEGA domain-containing protein, partial [Rhodothermales bacterium]|nr:PEGA domain-containing protein [Rhodothermales bacterium]
MLDIQKELEKFNRLLEDVDQDDEHEQDPPESVSDEDIPDAAPVAAADSEVEMESEPDEEVEAGPKDVEVKSDVYAGIPYDLPELDVAATDGGAPTEDLPTAFNQETATSPPIIEPTAAEQTTIEPTAIDSPVTPVPFSATPAIEEHSWKVVEHVQPADSHEDAEVESLSEDDAIDQPAAVTPVFNLSAQETAEYDESADSSAIEELDAFHETETPPADDVVAELPHRVPRLSKLVGFDSMMTGAKSALTGTHHQKPKSQPPVTVTLPSPEELEADVERERSIRDKLVPLLTYRAGMFEERLGTVVGVAAAFVVAIAGLLFVPRMISDDAEDPAALASSQADSDSVHLHASADAFGTTGEASLSVSTFPPGARVYIDADLVGVTPFQDITVAQGLQAISIKKSDFVSVDTMLEIGGSPSLYFELEADPSSQLAYEVDVPETTSSTPSVESNDRSNASDSAGRETPSDRDVAAIADVAAAGAVPERSSNPEEEPTRSTGSVVVTSEPAGATVFLDDSAVGETPLTLTDIVVGKARVTMQREGYVPYEIELNVMPSIQTPFHAVLARMKGRIEYRAQAGAAVYIDGTLIQQSAQTGSVELVDAGERSVRLVHPAYGEWSSTIDVRPDETTPIEVDLVD